MIANVLLQVARHAGVSFFFHFGCSFLIVSMFFPPMFVLALVGFVAVAVVVFSVVFRFFMLVFPPSMCPCYPCCIFGATNMNCFVMFKVVSFRSSLCVFMLSRFVFSLLAAFYIYFR